MKFSLGLDVLEKDDFEKVSLQEDVDDAWAHLNDCEIEEEDLSDDGEDHVVVNVSEGVVLFVGERFDEFVIDSLLESPDIFGLVLE